MMLPAIINDQKRLSTIICMQENHKNEIHIVIHRLRNKMYEQGERNNIGLISLNLKLEFVSIVLIV